MRKLNCLLNLIAIRKLTVTVGAGLLVWLSMHFSLASIGLFMTAAELRPIESSQFSMLSHRSNVAFFLAAVVQFVAANLVYSLFPPCRTALRSTLRVSAIFLVGCFLTYALCVVALSSGGALIDPWLEYQVTRALSIMP